MMLHRKECYQVVIQWKIKMTQEEIKLLINKLEDSNKNLRFKSSIRSFYEDLEIYKREIFFNNGQLYILRKLIND